MRILTILMVYVCCFSMLNAVSKTIYNPQTSMVGANSIALGHSPVLENDLTNVIFNPASISQLNAYPFSTTMYRLYGEFEYFVMSLGGPRTFVLKTENNKQKKRFGFSASYAQVKLDDIPNTVSYNDLPYEVGSYAAGFRVGHFAAATQFYDLAYFYRV